MARRGPTRPRARGGRGDQEPSGAESMAGWRGERGKGKRGRKGILTPVAGVPWRGVMAPARRMRGR